MNCKMLSSFDSMWWLKLGGIRLYLRTKRKLSSLKGHSSTSATQTASPLLPTLNNGQIDMQLMSDFKSSLTPTWGWVNWNRSITVGQAASSGASLALERWRWIADYGELWSDVLDGREKHTQRKWFCPGREKWIACQTQNCPALEELPKWNCNKLACSKISGYLDLLMKR